MKGVIPKPLPVILNKIGWPWIAEFETDAVQFSDKPLPKISIITPSYNQGQYLEETIRSIVLQNYPNYELIIIDGGSTDNTLEIIKKYESWITYWVSEHDRGQSHAIQKGIDKATGDIINWINSDDLVAPSAFHHIAASFDLNNYDVICGYCDYFVDDLDHLDKRNERMRLATTVGDTFLACHMNQPSTFFKASIIKNLGIDEQFRYTMDVDLWYRYLLGAGQSRILLLDELLTYFRLHSKSKSVAESDQFHGDNAKVYYNMMLSIGTIDEVLDYMKLSVTNSESFVPKVSDSNISKNETKSFFGHYAWLAMIYYNEIGNYKAARKCLLLAIKNGRSLNTATIRQLIKHFIIRYK